MFYFLLSVYAMILAFVLIRKTKPCKILLYCASGFAALMGLSYVMSAAGLQMPVNYFTAAASMLGGIPALIMLVFLQFIFR